MTPLAFSRNEHRDLSKGIEPMKYSLENLPDLIGEQDFKDLCIAIGIPAGDKVNGREFAEMVREHVTTSHLSIDRRREQLRQAGLV